MPQPGINLLSGPPNVVTPGSVPVSPTLGGVMAEAGLAVAGPIVSPDEVVAQSVKKLDPLSPLVSDFITERDLAITERKRLREDDWRIFEANIAGITLRTDAPAANSYTTSRAFLSKANELHQRSMGDMIRMLNPVGEIPMDCQVWEGDTVNVDLSSKLMTRIARQLAGMDWGKMARKMAAHMCLYGVAFLDGPNKPVASEMKWVAGKDGRMLVEDSCADQCGFSIISPKLVFPDPTGESVMDAAYFHIHCPWKPSQVEQWAKTLLNPANVNELLNRPPQLLTLNTGSSTDVQTASLKRYEIWRRVGFLTKGQFELLRETPFCPKDGNHDPSACWDVYYSPSDSKILHAEIRKVRPNKLCISPVPMLVVDGQFWPKGMQDSFAAIQDAINRAFRALDDQSEDLSGVQLIVDPDLVQDSDYSVRGRKTWLRRPNPLLPEESNRKAVEAFQIPNNIDSLIGLVKFYFSLIPETTGLPSYAFQPGATMGSGVRTEGQQTQLFESAASFIRHVMGNADEYGLEFVGTGIADFIGRQDSTLSDLQGTVKIIPSGTTGAMRREVLAKKLLDAFATLQNLQKGDWINDAVIPQIIADSHGFYGMQIVHTPETYVEAKKAKLAEIMAQEAAKNAAGDSPDVNERATSSVRDTLGTAFKSTMDQPNGERNPVAPLILKELVESCGKGSMAFYQGLSIWLSRIAKEASVLGEATPEQLAIYAAMPHADSPNELEANTIPGAAVATQDPQADPSNGVKATPEEVRQIQERLNAMPIPQNMQQSMDEAAAVSPDGILDGEVQE